MTRIGCLILIVGAAAYPAHPLGAQTCPFPDSLGPSTTVLDEYTLCCGYRISSSFVWSGSEYAVAWEDTSNQSVGNIHFARIDTAGQRIGDPVLLSGLDEDRAPSLVWSGSEYAVAWTIQQGAIAFLRIDATGTPIGSVLTANTFGYHPSLAWSGAQYGLVTSQAGLRFAAFDGAGQQTVAGTELVDDTGDPNDPHLVWNGTDYGLFWSDRRDGSQEIYFTRVNTAGTKVGPEIRVTQAAGDSIQPDAVWTGTSYGVVWDDARDGNREIYFVRLDALGAKLGTDLRLTSDPGISRMPSIAWTDQEFGVAWADAAGASVIYFSRVDAGGAQVGAAVVIDSGESRGDPGLNWTGTEFGVGFIKESESLNALAFSRIGCDCVNLDADGFTVCNECDDADDRVYPGSPEVCDGVNNDCDDPVWPALSGIEADQDGDGVAACQGDCDENDVTVHPGAPQLCDGLNNDCNDGDWPLVPSDEIDGDGDTLSSCEGDCDDTQVTVYPGASEICDGLRNDCSHPDWPEAPALESDDDGDAFSECAGDCNDSDSAVSPDGTEICNGIDDDCDTLTDEDPSGEDSDGDGVHNLCDNCVALYNGDQTDTDDDAVGNVCDNCIILPNADQEDLDSDGLGDDCDNCKASHNSSQDDTDGDSVGDACDNCFFDSNPSQSDMDADLQGDVCDLDDGMIYIRFNDPDFVEWHAEVGYTGWNSYRGDLDVLRTGGAYSQLPGSNDLANRTCGLIAPATFVQDLDEPDPGEVAFYLTTGVDGAGAEGDLGYDSVPALRPHNHACP